MRTDPAIIGQAPGPSTSGLPPLRGRSGLRLACLAGLPDLPSLRARAELLNLLGRWPGARGGKGDRFPLMRARSAAVALSPRLQGRRVVLLGRGVCAAFGLRGLPWLEAREVILPGGGRAVASALPPPERDQPLVQPDRPRVAGGRASSGRDRPATQRRPARGEDAKPRGWGL